MRYGAFIPRGLLRAATLAVLIALTLGSSPAFADAKPVKQKKEGRRAESHEIESLEQVWLRALMKRDTTILDRMMSDDFLAISANGNLSDKSQYLQRVSSGLNSFSSIDTMDIKVRVQPSAAVVVSQVRLIGQLDGRPVNGVFRYTKVYGRNAAGQWHVMNLEATRVSGMNPDGSDMHTGRPIDRIPMSLKH